MDSATMQNYIQAAFPTLTVNTCTPLGQGKAGAVFLVNENIVFKTHLATNQSESSLAAEYAALQALHGHTTLATPTPLHFATLSNGREIMGMGRMAGAQFTQEIYETLTEAEQTIIYAQMGEFLHEMHTLQTAKIKGAPDYGSAPTSDYFYENYTDIVKNTLTDTEQARLAQIVHDYETILRGHPPPVVLNHGDLHFWNMHYDPATKRLCGVLDFGLVCYHDPLNDMCYFWSDSVEKMLTSYPAPLGAGAATRHLFHNVCNLIEEARSELENTGASPFVGYLKDAMWQKPLAK